MKQELKKYFVSYYVRFIHPKSGDIIYKNKSIFQNLDEWRKEIGYISQNIYLLDSTIEKNIAFNFLDESLNKEN